MSTSASPSRRPTPVRSETGDATIAVGGWLLGKGIGRSALGPTYQCSSESSPGDIFSNPGDARALTLLDPAAPCPRDLDDTTAQVPPELITAEKMETDGDQRFVVSRAWDRTLEEATRIPNQLAVDQTRRVATAVSRALAHLHARGIAHGLVDPGHIYRRGSTWHLGCPVAHTQSATTCMHDDLVALDRILHQMGVERSRDHRREPEPAWSTYLRLTRGERAAHMPKPLLSEAVVDEVRVATEGIGISARLPRGVEMHLYLVDDGITHEAGELMLADDLRRGVLGRCIARAVTSGKTVRVDLPTASPSRVIPVAVEAAGPALARVGAAFEISGVPDVENLHAVPDGERFVVDWTWPGGVTGAIVVVRREGFGGRGAGAADEHRVAVQRGSEPSGRAALAGLEPGPWHVAVYASISVDGCSRYATGQTPGARRILDMPIRVGFRVDHPGPIGRMLGERPRLSVWSNRCLKTLPPLTLGLSLEHAPLTAASAAITIPLDLVGKSHGSDTRVELELRLPPAHGRRWEAGLFTQDPTHGDRVCLLSA